MTSKQIQELEILGFRVSNEDARCGVSLFSETIPDLHTLEKLLMTLTFDDEMHYWDAYQKSPTDPGGYVTAIRMDEEHVAYMEGNHGWTSKWYIVSTEEMAKHIQKNWNKDCDEGMYSNKVLIRQNRFITREKILGNVHMKGGR